MKLTIEGFANGAAIPTDFAMGKIDPDSHATFAANINPAVAWADLPEGTKSLALICHDPDVPSVGDDVNQEGKTVPADLPRVDFFHWVLVDIDPSLGGIAKGADCNGVTAGGKAVETTPHGRRGINNYTDWFAGDPDMGGTYGGYDGPFPPWNDSILHHYVFTLYALDTDRLPVDGNFGGPEVREAMQGHILADASWTGLYSLNPDVTS